jgi:hypothetical protein
MVPFVVPKPLPVIVLFPRDWMAPGAKRSTP